MLDNNFNSKMSENPKTMIIRSKLEEINILKNHLDECKIRTNSLSNTMNDSISFSVKLQQAFPEFQQKISEASMVIQDIETEIWRLYTNNEYIKGNIQNAISETDNIKDIQENKKFRGSSTDYFI